MNNANMTLKDSLILTVILILILVYVQWLWSRRKLYLYSYKVNGPISLPLIGCTYLFIGQPSDTFANLQYLFNKYPKFARAWFGHRLFYGIQDPKYVDIILSSCKALAKEKTYKFAEGFVGKGLFTAPLNCWRTHRKLLNPTFNQRILDGFVEIFAEKAEITVKQLESKCSKDMDIYYFMAKATIDIICVTAMGVEMNAQTSDIDFGYYSNRAMEIIFKRMFNILYHPDLIFNLTPLKRELDSIKSIFHEFSEKVVKDHRSSYEKQMQLVHDGLDLLDSNKRKIFLNYMIEHTYTKDGPLFTDEELRQEVDTFIITGFETTATMNSYILMILGMFPEIQRQVYHEIINIIGHERPAVYSDLPHLKYLEAVIKETLRLFPVAAFVVRSIDGDVNLGEFTIPRGASATIAIFNIHRNPEYWPDPLKFDPERFLPPNNEKIIPASYIPFSWGPRNCIGQKYAMMSMKTLVATIIRNYEIKSDYQKIEEVELKTNIILKPKYGFKVHIQKREFKCY